MNRSEEAYAFRNAASALRASHVEPIEELISAAETLAAAERKRAVDAEHTLNTMRPVWDEGPEFPARIALGQIWHLLGANNQTEAMTKLRMLITTQETMR